MRYIRTNIMRTRYILKNITTVNNKSGGFFPWEIFA